MNIIHRIKSTNNPLLVSEAASVEKWKDLPHNKSGLELFLQFNIAELKFKPKSLMAFKTVICTSNTQFISVFTQRRESLKNEAAAKVAFSGIYTKDSDSVMSFNLLTNRYNTISIRAWEIVNFVSIIPENVVVLDQIVNDILGRKIQKS